MEEIIPLMAIRKQKYHFRLVNLQIAGGLQNSLGKYHCMWILLLCCFTVVSFQLPFKNARLMGLWADMLRSLVICMIVCNCLFFL